MIKKTILICFILASFFSKTSLAQVTIGSTLKPEEGTLLSLKEFDPDTDGGANSTKGLLLPRVNILYSDHFEVLHGVKESEKDIYIGTVVYNLNENRCNLMRKGIHTWNGSKWTLLSSDDEIYGDGVTKHVDQNGNPFLAQDFGDGGIWMTENIRATSYDTESNGFGKELTKKKIQNVTDKDKYYWIYPHNASGTNDGTNSSIFDSNKSFGLLYTWYAATGREEPSPIAEEWNSTQEVQGICPNGWHVPNNKEMLRLAKEVVDNPSKYTDYTTIAATGASWSPAYLTKISTDSKSNNLTNIGRLLKTVCQPIGSSITPTGKSKLAQEGGFNWLMSGDGTGDGSHNFDISGYIWTSCTYGASPRAYRFIISKDNHHLTNNAFARGLHSSVRCVKNQSVTYNF